MFLLKHKLEKILLSNKQMISQISPLHKQKRQVKRRVKKKVIRMINQSQYKKIMARKIMRRKLMK